MCVLRQRTIAASALGALVGGLLAFFLLVAGGRPALRLPSYVTFSAILLFVFAGNIGGGTCALSLEVDSQADQSEDLV
jgi:high-affinity Fe2+/Pb2+ permease